MIEKQKCKRQPQRWWILYRLLFGAIVIAAALSFWLTQQRPSAETILYVHEGILYRIGLEPDAEPEQLSDKVVSSFQVGTNKRTAILQTTDGMYEMNLHTLALTLLDEAALFEEYYMQQIAPILSPDGRYAAMQPPFNMMNPRPPGNCDELTIVEVEFQNPLLQFESACGNPFAVWHPDSQRVLLKYHQGDSYQLSLVNVVTGEETVIQTDLDSFTGSYDMLDWNAAGTQFLYLYINQAGGGFQQELWLYDIKTQQERFVVPAVDSFGIPAVIVDG